VLGRNRAVRMLNALSSLVFEGGYRTRSLNHTIPAPYLTVHTTRMPCLSIPQDMDINVFSNPLAFFLRSAPDADFVSQSEDCELPDPVSGREGCNRQGVATDKVDLKF